MNKNELEQYVNGNIKQCIDFDVFRRQGGKAIDSVRVNVVGDTTKTFVDLKVNDQDGPINVASGSNVVVSWTSTNADRCEGDAGGSGFTAVPTSYTIPINVIQSGTLTVTCYGTSGTATDTARINVGATSQNKPAVDMKFNGQDGPVTVQYGSSVTVSWTSANVDACTGQVGDSVPSPIPTSYTLTVTPTQSGTLKVECKKDSESVYDIVYVNVT